MQREVKELEPGSETLEADEKLESGLEPNWQAKQRDAPATSSKLRNWFTGNLHPILPIRTRSGRYRDENDNTGGGAGAGNNHTPCCTVSRERASPALVGVMGATRSRISTKCCRNSKITD